MSGSLDAQDIQAIAEVAGGLAAYASWFSREAKSWRDLSDGDDLDGMGGETINFRSSENLRRFEKGLADAAFILTAIAAKAAA